MRKKNKVMCVLFACFLGLSFFLCILFPKEDYSYSERRKLAKMPELSLDSVLNGRFMTGFDSYAQDQFPFRESFRKLKPSLPQKVSNGRIIMVFMRQRVMLVPWNIR